MNKQIKNRKKHKPNQDKLINDLPKNFTTANRTGDYRNVLKLLSWNIESRNTNKDSKFNDLKFLRILGDRDFICLQETKGPVYLPNYRSFNINRVDSTSGGVAILVKNELSKGVSVIKSDCTRDILAIKLNKLFLTQGMISFL